ncbi:hypothetical protein CRYUN_Cryun07bG0007400 [Craigia yunnanensis]
MVQPVKPLNDMNLTVTVGSGGSPDENGETTIDALLMNGATTEVGAVAAMRYVKDGFKAARLVMQHTKHTMIVEDRASSFAISMDLSGPTNLSSSEYIEKWTRWKENHLGIIESRTSLVGPHNYNTISVAVFYKIPRSKPKLAAKDAISRIARKFMGAVVAINKNGVHAGACHGWTFQYSVRNSDMDDVKVFTVLS